MDTPTKTPLVTRLWLAVCRLWDYRMQDAAPGTPATVWFPQDDFAETLVRDPFRSVPSSEDRWAATRCQGHGGVTSVRYCEDRACVKARAAMDAWVASQDEAA